MVITPQNVGLLVEQVQKEDCKPVRVWFFLFLGFQEAWKKINRAWNSMKDRV
jgi:hypothetical protein